MPDVRCPKHDRIFTTITDHRMPGSGAAKNLAAHPANGHPDCPKCQEEEETKVPQVTGTTAAAPGTKRKIG